MRLATIPRFLLATLPTPLLRARNLEAALGPKSPRIYLKRDDLTGLAFGDNKVRKLEFLLAEATAAGATGLVTKGAAQSNHARVSVAAAAVAGLRSVLILDARNVADVAGNLLLDRLMGAEVRIVPDKAARVAAMEEVSAELWAYGERPFIVPTGGSVPLGAVGYVAAVCELLEQLTRLGEAPELMVTSTSSMGTQAGLVVGAHLFTAPFRVLGIAAEHGANHLAATGAGLASATAELLGVMMAFDAGAIAVDVSQVGDGYGKPTRACLEAIRLLARTEAVFLDPVYSGKAMAGLIARVRGDEVGDERSVVFLHTGGGPSLFPWGERLLHG